MRLFYDEIRIKKRLLLTHGFIDASNTGVIMITGKNGAGKTLLLKNIFANAKNGAASFEFVDQYNNSVIESLSVIENIAVSDDKTVCEDKQKEVEQLGFGFLLTKKTNKLSGGEKRMIGILRGILSDANVIIIDEPTNDLDYSTVSAILDILGRVSQSKLLIMVSHDDRVLKRFGNNIFEIQNHCLRLNHCADHTFDSSSTYHVDIGKNRLPSLPRKAVSFNIVTIVLTLLFSYFCCVVQSEYITDLKNEKTKMVLNDNQIILYHPVSLSMGTGLFSDVFPASMIDLLYSHSMFRKMTAFDELKKDYNKRTTVFDLAFKSSDAYTVYPIEFYDPVERKTYLTFDIYLEKFYKTNSELSYVNTSHAFVQPWVKTEEKEQIEFNEDIFWECVSELGNKNTPSGGQLEITCIIIVVAEGYAVSDFLESEEMKPLKQGSSLISTNTIIDMIDSVNKFSMAFRSILKVILCWLIIVVSDILALLLKLKNDKNSIFVLKNHGYSYDGIVKVLMRKGNMRICKLCIWFLGTMILLHLCGSMCRLDAAYYIILLYTVVMSASYSIDSYVIETALKRCMMWSAR